MILLVKRFLSELVDQIQYQLEILGCGVFKYPYLSFMVYSLELKNPLEAWVYI